MKIAVLLRYMQFYAHMGHNLLGGKTFFQDHSFLGDLYGAYEDEYDSVVERMIGLGEELDLIKVHENAAAALDKPESYEKCFNELLTCEEHLCKMIEEVVKESSQGTMQLLGGIADNSEMRQYKLKQRLK